MIDAGFGLRSGTPTSGDSRPIWPVEERHDATTPCRRAVTWPARNPSKSRLRKPDRQIYEVDESIVWTMKFPLVLAYHDLCLQWDQPLPCALRQGLVFPQSRLQLRRDQGQTSKEGHSILKSINLLRRWIILTKPTPRQSSRVSGEEAKDLKVIEAILPHPFRRSHQALEFAIWPQG